MDIHLLRTFVAAFEEANFTKAARRLNATQPGVSAQIAALEAEVGTALFDRNARSVTPTAAGQHLYPRALKLIHDLNSAAQEVRSLSGTATGRLAVGLSSTVNKAVIAPVLTRFLDAYPRVEVRILEEYTHALSDLIEMRELDIAFVTDVSESRSINYRKVFSDHFVVACAKAEPSLPIHLDVETYYKIVLPPKLRRDLFGVLDDRILNGRIIAARTLQMDGLAGTLEFVAKSDWIALLPAAAAYNQAESTGVCFCEIAGEQIAIDYHVAHARTEPISIAAKAFIDLVTAEMARAALRWKMRMRVPATQLRLSRRA